MALFWPCASLLLSAWHVVWGGMWGGRVHNVDPQLLWLTGLGIVACYSTIPLWCNSLSASLKWHFQLLELPCSLLVDKRDPLLPDTHSLPSATPSPYLEDKYLCSCGDSFPINSTPLTSINYHRSLSWSLSLQGDQMLKDNYVCCGTLDSLSLFWLACYAVSKATHVLV